MSLDAERLAAALWRARRAGETVDPPDGLDVAAAGRVLDALEAAAGEPVAAFKVGATAPGGAEKMGLAAPFVGPVFAPYVKEIGTAEASARLPSQNGLGAELEIVFRFARAVPPGAAPPDVAAAVDAIAPGIEIVASRLSAPTEPKGPGLVADHAGNGLLLVGAFDGDWRGLDLASLEATLHVDGAVAGRSKGANVMGDPMNALVHFAREMGARGRTVPAGAILTSGAIVGPLPVAPGAYLAGEISGLMPVAARVEVALEG